MKDGTWIEKGQIHVSTMGSGMEKPVASISITLNDSWYTVMHQFKGEQSFNQILLGCDGPDVTFSYT